MIPCLAEARQERLSTGMLCMGGSMGEGTGTGTEERLTANDSRHKGEAMATYCQ